MSFRSCHQQRPCQILTTHINKQIQYKYREGERKMDKKQEKYNEARDKVYKLMDEIGMHEALGAMIDTIVDTMGNDALEFMKDSLEISKEIDEEEKDIDMVIEK